MNILHTIRSVDPNAGGTVEALRQSSLIHASQGHHIQVLSCDHPEAPFLFDFPLPIQPLGPGAGLYGYTPRFIPWLRRHAREYDAVIVHGLWQYHSLATRKAIQGSPTPYFVFPHGMLDPWFKQTYPLKHLKKSLYWIWSEYPVLRDAQAVLFTCEEERRLATQSFRPYRCREKTVSLGISPPPPPAPERNQRLFETFPELRDKRILLFLGRIHPKKGCDLLIRAFASTCENDPNLHLLLAGPDSAHWKQELLSLARQLGISNKITWPGPLFDDLKWAAFQTAEVFLLPSHQENFGIAVAEALACGTPVLISDKVNIWREIQNARAGLVEKDDLPGTTALLEKWLRLDTSSRRELRANAKKCFETTFEIRQAAHTWIQAIEPPGETVSSSPSKEIKK